MVVRNRDKVLAALRSSRLPKRADSQSSATFPWGFRPHMIDQEAHALVVGRIQPEHTIESAPSLIETAEAPKA